MKTVFSNSQCAHVWAQQNQPCGRSLTGSMRFDGPTAYSYAQPVAKFVTDAAGRSLVLFTSRYWSLTTSSHVGLYKSAVANLAPRFTVPRIDGHSADHAENVAYIVGRYNEELSRLMRSPSDSYRLTDCNIERELSAVAHTLFRYEDAFKLPASPIAWQADAGAVKARRDKLLGDPKRVAARAAKEAKLAEDARRQRIEMSARLELEAKAWRDGTLVKGWGSALHHAPPMLRLNAAGDTVETSHGANVSLEDARRVLAFICSVWDANNVWTGNNGVGHFTLTAIDADAVTVGCHRFERAELERFIKETL